MAENIISRTVNTVRRFFSVDQTSQMETLKKENNRLVVGDFAKNIGVSGTDITNGYIYDDYNTDLQGSKAIEIYEKMRRGDAQVQASLLICELPIRSSKWFIKPAIDENGEVTDEAWEVANYVDKALFSKMNKTWDDFLRECLTMLPFGFSVFEKIYYSDGEKVWIDKLAFRKQSSIIKWETEDQTSGVTQSNYFGSGNDKARNISIPDNKLLIFSHRREGDNYEGVSVLRSAYKHWKMKDNLYNFSMVRHERLSGFPIIYAPKNTSEPVLEKLEEIATNVRMNAQTGVVMPGSEAEGYKFDFADPKSGQSTNLGEDVNHHNRMIAINVLAQFLDLGSSSTGSFALSQDQSQMFLLSMESVAKYIQDTINRYLIKEIVDLNFDVNGLYPTLEHSKLGGVDSTVLSNSLKSLKDGGIITPDEDLEDYVREQLSLPARVKEDMTEENNQEVIEKKPEEITKDEEISQDEIDHNIEQKEMKELNSIINNKMIIKLMNECETEDDVLKLKKKGFRYNEYEQKAWRPLTFAERKVNFTSIKRSMDTFGQVLDDKLNEITGWQKEDLISQVKKAVNNNDIAAIGVIKAKYRGDLAQALTDVQKEMFEIGKKTAAVEMGVPVPPTKNEIKGVMRVQNDALVDNMMTNIENTAKTTVTQIAGNKGGSITNTTATEAIAEVSKNLNDLFDKAQNKMQTLALTGAINLGRTTIYERYPEKVYAMQYSAIIDDKTTNRCLSLDGRVVKPGSKEFYEYAPPQHYNCRSIWVEILEDEEFKPEIGNIPSSISPAPTIDNATDLKNPIIEKGSAAIKIIQQEIQNRKDKLQELQDNGQYENIQKIHKDKIKELERSIKNKFIEIIKEESKRYGIRFKND